MPEKRREPSVHYSEGLDSFFLSRFIRPLPIRTNRYHREINAPFRIEWRFVGVGTVPFIKMSYMVKYEICVEHNTVCTRAPQLTDHVQTS